MQQGREEDEEGSKIILCNISLQAVLQEAVLKGLW